jgi:RNA polymerase sigma-70 factor, ECF subfamily
MGKCVENNRRPWHERLRAVEAEAYVEFAKHFGVRFERWLIRRGYSEADASDVSRDALQTILFERLHKFVAAPDLSVEQSDAKFEAWVWQVARNYAESWRLKYRYHLSRKPLSADVTAADIVCFTDPNPRVTALREHLATLDDDSRNIMILKDFIGETTFIEVASILGIEEGTARVRYFRAKRKLKEKLIADPRCKLPDR